MRRRGGVRTIDSADWVVGEGVVPTDERPDAVLLGPAVHARVRTMAEALGLGLDEVARWPGVPILRGRDGAVPPFGCYRIWGLAGALEDDEMRRYFDESDPAFAAAVDAARG